MDNCVSEPFKALEEKDLPVLIEYLDCVYRWVQYVQYKSLDAMAKLIEENPSFKKWLDKFILNKSYRLYVGKNFPKEDDKPNKVPKVGSMVERSGNKSHNWTTSWGCAVTFSRFHFNNKDKFDFYNGGCVGKCIKQVSVENVIADIRKVHDFFATDSYEKVYDDISRLYRLPIVGMKFELAIDKLYGISKKVYEEKEIVTTGNINVYEVVANWVVDHEHQTIIKNGDWGSKEE
jgi:hypothetical protein